MINIKDYVQCYENILDKKICEDIIHSSKEEDFRVTGIQDHQLDRNFRRCYVKTLDKNFNDIIYKSLGELLLKYKKTFPNFSTGLSLEDTGYEHLFYKASENGEYKQHVDHFDLFPRVLSCSFILNDNYKGGNFAFFNGEYVVEKKQGSVILFPSNFCFPHAVTPVSKSDRHSVITWIH
jgi:predicted 2-oxoglutarate/Fe(II)-dependent dioxygenase YbiX